MIQQYYYLVNELVKNNRKIVFIAVFLYVVQVTQGFSMTITGKVVDDQDQPLPGVNVLVKGTATGTTTDVNGNFALTIPGEKATLVFSFIGFAFQEVRVNNEATLNVKLLPDITSLGEVIVVGYGSQRRSDIAGSVASVSTQDIKSLPVTRVDQALQGRAAGVLVQNNDASPNGSVTIRIRGGNSLTGSNDPLVVINGFLGGDLASINPNDVESIEVLKDASATAIYGSRGANGVILVTTKSGVTNKPLFQYNSFVNFATLRKKLDIMSAGDYAQTINENRIESGGVAVFTSEQIAAFRQNGGTDWQDQIFQRALQQNHQLNASGGNKHTTYFVSANYVNNGGIIKNTSFQRYSVRSNLKSTISDNLNVGLNLFLSRSKDCPTTLNNFNGGNAGSPVFSARLWAPTASVYDSDGDYTLPSAVGAHYLYNPLALALEPIYANKEVITEANAFGELTLLQGLTLRVMGGGRVTDGEYDTYVNNKPSHVGDAVATISNSRFMTLQNTNQLTYLRTLAKDHNVNVTAVFEQQSETYNSNLTGSKGFLTDAITYNNLGLGATPLPPSSYANEKTIESFMGRMIYSFKNKYLINVASRFDGASVFGNSHKWGFFPSAAVAWKISNEAFMKKLPSINNLKLRMSYGMTGNQGIPPYGSLSQLNTGARYALNGTTLSPGVSLGSPENPDLKWEKTAQLDIGVDAVFFGDRIALTVDYYRKETSDLLMNVPLPLTSGYSSVLKNVGKVENEGTEISLGGKPVVGDFAWTSTFTAAINHNTVIALDGQSEIPLPNVGLPNFGNTIFLTVGQPMGVLKGYIQEGVWSTSESDKAKQYGSFSGAPRYVDQNSDGKIDDKDIAMMGNTTPKITFGWTNTFSFKGFDLNVFFQGVQGNKIYNLSRVYMDRTTGDADGTSTVLLNRWAPDHQNSNIPSFTGSANEQLQTNRWLEDGSYIRLKNVTLGYNFPPSILKNKIKDARLYVSGVNLLTITKYTGYDPEARISSDQTTNIDTRNGIDLATYPSQKIFTIGMNLTF